MVENSIEKQYKFPEEELDIKRFFFILFRKRWILLSITCIIMMLDLVYTFKQTPLYRATSLVLIETPARGVSLSPSAQEEVVPLIGSLDYYNTQYAILQSRMLAKRVSKALDLKSLEDFHSEFPENIFREMITIDPVRKTRLVEVSIDYKDPEMAVKMANTLVSLYIEQNIENLLFMSKEILQAFPEKASEIESHTVYGQLKDLSKEEMFEYLPSVVNNLVLQQLKAEKIATEAELAHLSKRYKAKHPKVIALNNKLKFVNAKIDTETNRILGSIRSDLAGQLQANNIRVIDYAEIPEKPIKPKPLLNILLGLFLSLFLGTGIIFFTEYLDNSVRDEDDVEKKLGIPYLGDFPFLKNLSSIKDNVNKFDELDKKDPDAFESIRTLRTNIIFSTPKSKLKSILFTSATAQEGKSFLASYLAVSFAKNGEKTLIIDGDVRRPFVNKLFKFDQAPGLTNVLVENASIKSVIKETSYKNLYILPAGSKTPNPVELLGSNKMRTLLERDLPSEFAKIIIDAPPALMLSDALILSKMCAATVLVIKAGVVSLDALTKLKVMFASSGSRVIGAVLNCFDIKLHAHYYKYRYYHDHYKSYYPKAQKKK